MGVYGDLYFNDVNVYQNINAVWVPFVSTNSIGDIITAAINAQVPGLLTSTVSHNITNLVIADIIQQVPGMVNSVVSQNISNLVSAEIGQIVPKYQIDAAYAVPYSMVLIQLSHLPINPSQIEVLYNGNALIYNVDFVIANNVNVIASSSLNQTFNGVGQDGAGV